MRLKDGKVDELNRLKGKNEQTADYKKYAGGKRKKEQGV